MAQKAGTDMAVPSSEFSGKKVVKPLHDLASNIPLLTQS